MPLQVVAGFLESDRAIKDSGVCGMKGIMSEIGDPVEAQYGEGLPLHLYLQRKLRKRFNVTTRSTKESEVMACAKRCLILR